MAGVSAVQRNIATILLVPALFGNIMGIIMAVQLAVGMSKASW
jgi:hypothetical protein